MMAWKKIAVAAGCGVVYVYVRKMFITKANLIVTPSVSVHSISLTGLILRADVQIKNPSSGSFSIKFPFVSLSYKDTLLGSSQVVNQDIAIKAYSEARIEKILITIPLASLFTVVSTLIDAIQDKKTVKIVVKMVTVVNLGWKKINYEDKQEISLKN